MVKRINSNRSNNTKIDDIPKIKNIDVIVNKLGNYEAARGNIKLINKNSHNFGNRRPKIHENMVVQNLSFNMNNMGIAITTKLMNSVNNLHKIIEVTAANIPIFK